KPTRKSFPSLRQYFVVPVNSSHLHRTLSLAPTLTGTLRRMQEPDNERLSMQARVVCLVPVLSSQVASTKIMTGDRGSRMTLLSFLIYRQEGERDYRRAGVGPLKPEQFVEKN